MFHELAAAMRAAQALIIERHGTLTTLVMTLVLKLHRCARVMRPRGQRAALGGWRTARQGPACVGAVLPCLDQWKPQPQPQQRGPNAAAVQPGPVTRPPPLTDA